MTPNLQTLIRLIFNYLQIEVNLSKPRSYKSYIPDILFLLVSGITVASFTKSLFEKKEKESFVTWETPAKLQQEFKKTSLRLAVSSGSWSHELMRFCYLENFARGRLRGKCVCKTKAKKGKKKVQHITNWKTLLLIVVLDRYCSLFRSQIAMS